MKFYQLHMGERKRLHQLSRECSSDRVVPWKPRKVFTEVSCCEEINYKAVLPCGYFI